MASRAPSSCYSLGTMAHSQGQARRLLNGLPKKTPEQLLRSRSYANAGFLALFFEWLDELIFQDPQEGLRWARVAPDLARKTPVLPEGRQAHRERSIMAFAVLGSAYRACGDYDASDEAYAQALELAEKSVSDIVRANTDRRVSYLRACQGRADEALELASGAVERLRAVAGDAQIKLSQALISKGYALASALGRHGEAIELFGEALALAGDAKGDAKKRLHASACHNLALAITESSAFADQTKAMHYVTQARKSLRGQKRSAARYRLLWVEGLIWKNMGSHAKSERLFQQALEGFQALKMPWLIALVGLDLAALLHLCGDWVELQKIAADTYQRFRLLAADTAAITALSLWNDAVKARQWDEAKLARARRIVAAGVCSSRRRERRRN